jgi:hypothetical protein
MDTHGAGVEVNTCNKETKLGQITLSSFQLGLGSIRTFQSTSSTGFANTHETTYIARNAPNGAARDEENIRADILQASIAQRLGLCEWLSCCGGRRSGNRVGYSCPRLRHDSEPDRPNVLGPRLS